MHLLNFLSSLSTPTYKLIAIFTSLSLIKKKQVLLFPSTVSWTLVPPCSPYCPIPAPVSYSKVMHITLIFKENKQTKKLLLSL